MRACTAAMLALLAAACGRGTGEEATAGSPAASEAQPEPRSVASGVFTKGQVDRGRVAYGQVCAQCHLPDLSGIGVAPALRGELFLQERANSSVGDFYAELRSTMPQDAAFSLEPQVYADIVSFLLSENGAPAGPVELPTVQAALDAITFDDGGAVAP